MLRKLNDKQLDVLITVLRFRYVTADNLAIQRNISHNSAYSALEILNKSGYLGKLHDKSYRLMNKSARYFLTKQATDLLKTIVDPKQPEAIWKSRLRDGSRSTEFIDQQVAIHAAYNALVGQFGDDVYILTALDQYGTEGIIKPIPGLLVTPNKEKHFFVELADNQHLFLIRKRIRKYIQNYDNHEWEWDEYPDVYIVRATTANDRTRLRKYASQKMEEAYLDDEDFIFEVVNNVKRVAL
jgi:hypothetical protein